MKKILINGIFLFLFFSFIVSINGCSFFTKKYEKTETQEYKLNTSGKEKITVENQNGTITIRKSDSDSSASIKLDYTTNVSKKDLDANNKIFDLKIDTAGKECYISAQNLIREKSFINLFQGGERINYSLSIPAYLKVRVENHNGSIEIEDISGEVDAETVNGEIKLNNTKGNLKGNTVNGKISASLDVSSDIDFNTVNGSVSLTIPESFAGKFKMSCVNGSIKYDEFNFKDVTKEKKDFEGTLGNADKTIKITTVNGSIKLKKK
jgi:hypothetical protein